MSDYLAAPYCSDASALARFLKGLKLQVARLPRFVVHEPWPQPNMLGPFCCRVADWGAPAMAHTVSSTSLGIKWATLLLRQ
jgi:hypothetical protein